MVVTWQTSTTGTPTASISVHRSRPGCTSSNSDRAVTIFEPRFEIAPESAMQIRLVGTPSPAIVAIRGDIRERVEVLQPEGPLGVAAILQIAVPEMKDSPRHVGDRSADALR